MTTPKKTKIDPSRIVEWVKTSSLKPNPKNRNKHSDEQIDRLAKLISFYGFRVPIIVSTRSQLVVSGHGRLEAAKRLKLETVPVSYQDFKDEDSEYGFGVSDNGIALWAELDLKAINIDIPGLGLMDIDLLGIKDFEIDPADKYADKNADDVPDIKKTKIKLGDLFQLGNHRLLCGDATVKEDVERLMNGEKADMIYTDPPYGMNLDTEFDSMFKSDSSHVKTGNRFKRVQDDDKDYDPSPMLGFDCQKFIWGCDYFYDKLPKGGSFIAWDKRNENLDAVPGNTAEFCWAYPPVRRMTCRILWSGHHGMQKDDSKMRVHPTQKPTALHEWFFERWGKDKINIADLYLGSGSTLIACEKTNRRCFGMEIDPQYCQVIIDRWEKFTGQKHVKL